ncbi:FUSC family protein [Intestinibacillus massiliensis]|uniref:FUSC family protein n=1 Tax=Intestinibacillus massiliensis TaxID=1871029 RepID=UPI000B361125|nr:FUSC family protein [Intestinibacillus massiliensis]
MTITKEKALAAWRVVRSNTLQYLFMMAFILVYAGVFGQSETLAAVALVMGLMMFPRCDIMVRPVQAAAIIFVLYVGCGLFPALSMYNMWLGLLINFGMVALILLLTAEPMVLKVYINFCLAYIFCQGTPVHGHALAMRLAGLAAGALFIIVLCIPRWAKYKGGEGALALRPQIRACAHAHAGFILRMACGLSLAMFAGAALRLQKPLWLNVVVFSLTQPEFHDMVLRIKYRIVGTVIGAVLFIVVFRVLIPQEYAYIIVLLLGYLTTYSFAKQYKYQQVINAMSALYASLVLLDTSVAVTNRLACLAGGIAIVLLVHGLSRLARSALRRHGVYHGIESA